MESDTSATSPASVQRGPPCQDTPPEATMRARTMPIHGLPCAFLAPRPSRWAFTLPEILLGAILLALLLGGMFSIFRGLTGKRASSISQKLALQMEARRALINIYSVIQEGIEVLKPDGGSTLPYLVFRDRLNNVHLLFLKKDQTTSERLKTDIYRLHTVVYDIAKGVCSPIHEILGNIVRMNFTAHGFSSVVITSTLQDGDTTFSFVNLVRLKNALAEEGS